jgi:hypothetical protein
MVSTRNDPLGIRCMLEKTSRMSISLQDPRHAIIYKAKPTTTAPTPINPAIPAGSKVLPPEVDEAEVAADDAPEAAEETFDAPVAATEEAE